MGPNSALLINTVLQGLMQMQQYQALLAKAAAEGRDVTDEEVEAARVSATAAIDALAAAGPAA
jgi:hypothetical protein